MVVVAIQHQHRTPGRHRRPQEARTQDATRQGDRTPGKAMAWAGYRKDARRRPDATP